ncbi:type VI secretion system baseplate subunit TssF [Marinobacterium jannaschii]|uniref:type VI secretion system baseplate subunit TssF n=1 Tax=Marinobacterium jannaschii TaxID=64970 RepID=UPI000489AE93|nr:type VI secretion system baseplate subunit TssF [Marinobacterium jannaschii]
MSDQLMRYYERELASVRKSLASFAQRHPEQAAQLQLNQSGVEDPNISRLIDGMALLTAKTEQRLDEQLPELLQDLFSLLYPGYLQLIPGYTALTLETDPEQLNENVLLPKGSEVVVTQPQGDCTFTTCADLQVYPFQIDRVDAEAAPFSFTGPGELCHADSVIRIQLSCCDPDSRFSQLQVGDLDFYVRGFENSAASLIEILLQQTELISVSSPDGAQHQTLPGERLQSRVADPGFQWLPRHGNQFAGFDLLRDYFAYPDKGAYFRIAALGEQLSRIDAATVTLNFFVRGLPAEFLRLFDASVFCLNTVPALNLFRRPGEPLNYDFSRLSMPVLADAWADSDIEVVSLDRVREVLPDGERELRPLYQVRYRQDRSAARWQSRQRYDETGQRHVELALSSEQPSTGMVLALDLHCCNGRAPCRIAAGTVAESLAAIDLPGELKLLNSPSAPHYPALDNDLHWRFIALLNANFATLLQTDQPAEALRDLLSLCAPGNSCRQAETITDVSYRQQVAPMQVAGHNIFATGTEVTVTLDAVALGDQAALLGEVLNGFYRQFCSYDRFIQLQLRHFGSDRSGRSYPRVHGSQLCL